MQTLHATHWIGVPPEEWLVENTTFARVDLKSVDPRAKIRRVSLGDRVKLTFRSSVIASDEAKAFFDDQGDDVPDESMWVVVTSIDGNWPDLSFEGELDDSPSMADPFCLKCGSTVPFRLVHIMKIG